MVEDWNDGEESWIDGILEWWKIGKELGARVQESVVRRPKNDVRVEDRLFYHSSNYSSGGRILRRPGSAVIIAPDCSSLPYFAIILTHIDPCSLAARLTRRRIPE